MNQNKIQKIKNGYIADLMKLAGQFAKKDMAIIATAEHLMSAVLEHLAGIYVFNLNVSAKLNSLTADIEALRRAIPGDGTQNENI